MKISLVLVVLVTEASANPVTTIYVGAGLPTDPEGTGETSTLIGGAAIALREAGRHWEGRFAVDVGRIAAPDDVFTDDLRREKDAYAVAIRTLAGIRIRGSNARLSWFGQLSAGLQWERSTSSLFFRPNASEPFQARGKHSYSDTAFVLEPAIGAAVRFGKLELGLQMAVAGSSEETVMPTEVNETPRSPTHLLATLFAERTW